MSTQRAARPAKVPAPDGRSRGVLLLHGGRVGSTVLGDLMDQRPDVRWKGELLQRLLHGCQRGRGALARGEDPVERFLRSLSRPGEPAVVASELTLYHLRGLGLAADPGAFVDRVVAGGYREVVWLRRRNTLRRVISSLTAFESGRWHRAPGEQAPWSRVRLDPAAVAFPRGSFPLVETLELWERDDEALAAAVPGRPIFRLTYEDDIEADPLVAYRKLCEHLRLPPHPVEVRLRRGLPEPVRELVTNPAEVEAALAGTRFAWMLDG